MEREEGNSVLDRDFKDSEEVYVKCLKNGSYCGKCCIETEMPLTEEDLSRIESLGFSREEFSVSDGDILRLRNVKGKCYFLDERNACRIYEHHPEGCRLYPAVFDGEDVVVDRLCPVWEDVKVSEVAKRRLLSLIKRVHGDKINNPQHHRMACSSRIGKGHGY
ncbi:MULTISPECIES: YkgJ family cysteine cluster protein [unclassified Archaeoglobus]|jgi:hypothetical protein|uniref:YkgJ family cysteine cluster protein n=1 Tax=unclassified Archaeoglobus TaxID=2643606 RepID=UPI0025C49FA2|nr:MULTISPECIES: YkgJ family cysteine cluster protein [unclassified Archaeoglobus]